MLECEYRKHQRAAVEAIRDEETKMGSVVSWCIG